MKVPLSWLRDYVDVDLDPHELAHRLTLAGVEAESVEVVGEGWENVIVGLVKAVGQHPDADRLSLATVETGDGELTVVCGAPNVAAGQKIAFAQVGARLIDAHTGETAKVKAAKIRGVESRGMVCSERELGLSDEHEGILVLAEDAPLGAPLSSYLGDVVIDFAVTPNRPDCLSVLGIAREVGALTGKPVREPDAGYLEEAEPIDSLTSVEVLDPDLCPRYIATVIKGVKVGPSPRWLQDRLNAAGMRPINNVVDITNFVMLEYGQPLHAFDYDRLTGGRIVVRRAGKAETMTTIDGQKRKLLPEMLIIADAARPVAVAGVMGGVDSEVSEATVNVLLESAAFDAISIRQTSRHFTLRSEASTRFDKGLSRELPLPAARRATQLLVEIAGGTAAKSVADVFPGKQDRPAVRLTTSRTEQVLGIGVSIDEMTSVLHPLGFESTAAAGGLSVVVPYWRVDIAIEEDLIEEIVRIKGYDWVPMAGGVGELPAFEPEPLLELKEAARDILATVGMNEAVNYSLTAETDASAVLIDGASPLRVFHPMSAELEALRVSLRGGLLRTLSANQRVQDEGVRLFESGRTYLPREGDLPEERETLAGLLSGPRGAASWQPVDGELGFFDAKGVLEALTERLGVTARYEPSQDAFFHPGRAARVLVGEVSIGVVGEVHPSVGRTFDLLRRPVAYFEIDLQALLSALPERTHEYRPIARFPSVVRDMALVLDSGIPSQRVAEIIEATPLVREVTLFDVYEGENVPGGKKSLAYHIVYQSPGRTLTGEEAEKTQAKLLQRLQNELGATLRGGGPSSVSFGRTRRRRR